MQSSDKTRGEWDIPGSENTGKGKQEEKKHGFISGVSGSETCAREGSAGGGTSLRCSEQGGGQGDRGK